MRQLFKKLIFAGAFLFLVASPVATLVVPQTSYAADQSTTCEPYLLGVIPPWYRGLTKFENGSCVIVSPTAVGGLGPFIWKIVLNGIQIALVLTSLVAFFFILYGAFLFLTGGGTPGQVEKGRKSILNAIIGLIISIGSVAITNLIFGSLVTVTPDPATGGIPHIDAKVLVHNGLNLLYYIAGIVAVIVIIIAGINYITSVGDSGKVTRAKNMVLYAVIGLGLLMAAFAITSFVVGVI